MRHLLCVLDVEYLLAVHPPGQAGEPLQVGAGHVELRRHRLKARQLVKLIRHNPEGGGSIEGVRGRAERVHSEGQEEQDRERMIGT